MAVNALLNIWSESTVQYNADDDHYIITEIVWLDDAPTLVREVIDGAVLFLRKESFNNEQYPAENAFFSGSSKTNETQPFFYPINYFEFRNGTQVNWRNVTRQDVKPG
eukprot:196520_1